MAADEDEHYADDFEPDEDAGAPWAPVRPGELEVGDQLGGGGFAIVCAGVFKGRPVAVKMIVDPAVTPEQQAEFLAELQAMASVRGHPNIVEVLAARVLAPAVMVMERCGKSLFAVLHGEPGADVRPISMETRLGYALDAARALAHLHARKPTCVIHRDVKSCNLLFGPAGDGHLKLCDFGLVGSRHTTAGTPAYMAPELLGDRAYNRSVDVYAYGVLLWEIFARQIPFAGWRPLDICQAVQDGTRPDVAKLPSTTPSVVSELIPQCWHAVPAKRPEMKDIVARLESWRPSATALLEASSVAAARGSRASGGVMDSLDMLAVKTKPAGKK